LGSPPATDFGYAVAPSESDALAHARSSDLLVVTHGGTLRVRSRILQEAFSLFFIKEEISLILWP